MRRRSRWKTASPRLKAFARSAEQKSSESVPVKLGHSAFSLRLSEHHTPGRQDEGFKPYAFLVYRNPIYLKFLISMWCFLFSALVLRKFIVNYGRNPCWFPHRVFAKSIPQISSCGFRHKSPKIVAFQWWFRTDLTIWPDFLENGKNGQVIPLRRRSPKQAQRDSNLRTAWQSRVRTWFY